LAETGRTEVVLALFNVLFDWAKVLFDKTDADDNGEVVPFDLTAICCCDGCGVVDDG
jgi:hypothetical protein